MDNSVLDTINSSDSIWMSNSKPIIIKLRISNDFADYFQENIIIPGETSREWNEENSLIVNIEASVYEEIKNIVKYWILMPKTKNGH